MSMSLAYRRYVLAPGETSALPTVPGALVRVIQGLVWATTSNGAADTWLRQGQEHEVDVCGLTVVEASPDSVEGWWAPHYAERLPAVSVTYVTTVTNHGVTVRSRFLATNLRR